jgi:hypothetical protein
MAAILFVTVTLDCGCTLRRFRYWRWLCPKPGDTVFCFHHLAAARVTTVTAPYSD